MRLFRLLTEPEKEVRTKLATNCPPVAVGGAGQSSFRLQVSS